MHALCMAQSLESKGGRDVNAFLLACDKCEICKDKSRSHSVEPQYLIHSCKSQALLSNSNMQFASPVIFP